LEDSLNTWRHYEAQSDFVLNLEYDHTKGFLRPKLARQDAFDIVQLFDNVEIAEYEVEYKGVFGFRSEKVQYHAIVRIGRGGKIIYDPFHITEQDKIENS